MYTIGNFGNGFSYSILEHYFIFRDNAKNQCLFPEELNELTHWLLKSLISFLEEKRNSFEEFEENAMQRNKSCLKTVYQQQENH